MWVNFDARTPCAFLQLFDATATETVQTEVTRVTARKSPARATNFFVRKADQIPLRNAFLDPNCVTERRTAKILRTKKPDVVSVT